MWVLLPLPPAERGAANTRPLRAAGGWLIRDQKRGRGAFRVNKHHFVQLSCKPNPHAGREGIRRAG